MNFKELKKELLKDKKFWRYYYIWSWFDVRGYFKK